MLLQTSLAASLNANEAAHETSCRFTHWTDIVNRPLLSLLVLTIGNELQEAVTLSGESRPC